MRIEQKNLLQIFNKRLGGGGEPVGFGTWVLPGYEPNDLQMMFTRRRATAEELAQGEKEMEEAQKRLDAEVQEGKEKPLEDASRPVAAEEFDSPKVVHEDAKGSEENPVGPPKSLHPPVLGQETAQVRSETGEQQTAKAPTPAAKAGSVVEFHQEIVPATSEVVAATVSADVQVTPNGPPSEGNVAGRVQRGALGGMTPASQSAVSPGHPLFDEQQLTRFQELHSQAPWLYPGGQTMFPQMPIQPPLARPLFLEQDERRLQGTPNVGDQPSFAYPYMVPPSFQENVELRKGLEAVLEENRKLKQRIEALENSKDEEDLKFSTPNDEVQEAERPPVEGPRNPKEAERPPLRPGGPLDPKEAERPPLRSSMSTDAKEAERPPVRPEAQKGSKEADRPPEKESSNQDDQKTMISVMLKLMEGMQETHKRIMDGRDDQKESDSEYVRSAQPLPPLAEWNAMSGPIDLGDWLALIEPMMSDLTSTSSEWWQTLMTEAYDWYQRHLQLQPLDRINHNPTPSAELARPKWSRLEKRASTMLLMAVPEGQREDLISSKRLTALGIVCQLLVIYQPGGLAEKELILRSLEQPIETSNLPEAVQSLRKWMRWRRRASDLKICEPDPFILLKGLNRIIRKPLESHRDLSFRISLARSTLQVDATPTSSSITSFALHLLDEFEQVVHQESAQTGKKKPEAEKVKTLKAKKVEEDGGRSPARKERGEDEKPKCKFYLTDSGCRRGKACQFSHDLKDDRRRCWTCGSVDHMAPACTRPKSATESTSPKARQQRLEGEGSSSTTAKEEDNKEESQKMKELLEQANTMLKSLTSPPATSSTSTTTGGGESKEEVMDRLQQQINQLKLKVFRINEISVGNLQGLVDSGATHPLRPLRFGETCNSYKKVSVTMANGETTALQLTPGGVMVTEKCDIEPILPMGHLVKRLGCEVEWKDEKLAIRHPKRGPLPVQHRNGCPQLPRALTLELIEELVSMQLQLQVKGLKFEEEKSWMTALVESHPVLRQLPQEVKQSLVVDVGEWRDLPVNRRQRKRLQRDGFIAHVYAGESDGFTLGRSWKQFNGDPNQLLEIDLKRGDNHNMLLDTGVYGGLMRAVMEDKLEALVGGPNCRTRSVLRHYPKDGAPRPVRRWGGEEHGLSDLTEAEQRQVTEDDILLWRFLFLWLVATYLRRARQVQRQVGLLLEQPASPKTYQPKCVSFWDTKEWQQLKSEFDLQEVTFCQGHHGGAATKPTTMAGNLELNVESHKMKRTEDTEVRFSSQLSRWAPGTMNMVSEALITQVVNQPPKLAPLSWQEHIQHGHVPFRRDCLVCQQSLQQQPPHRRVQHPIGGVLSLDTTGPFIRAHDLSGYKAAYILVGVLTWTVPKDSKLKEEDVPELEPGAPNFDAKESSEPLPLEDQPEEPQAEHQGVFSDEDEVEVEVEERREEKAPEGEEREVEEKKAPEGEEKKEGSEKEGPKEFETRIFRLAAPMFSKKAKEVVRAAMDMLLRLRADGFHVAHIHSDQGHEFSGPFRQWCRERGIHLTRTPGDDPRANGRAETAVKSVKTQIRRILLQAGADSSWWPWATRFVNELNRASRVGKKPDWPPFLTEVMVRKRKWRQGTFEVSTEVVKYLCPAPEEHGHWVLPKDEAPRVTKMLMKSAQLPVPEETWIALEKETVDALVIRRRMREKSTIRKIEEEESEKE